MVDQTHRCILPGRQVGTGVRNYNERLVLSAIQRLKSVASVDIARFSGLSAQTVSVIIRTLEADGLILRGAPRKGRVGKPSVPLTLNPDGALSFGLRIGRRGADLVLCDLTGEVRAQTKALSPHPTPERVMAFLKDGIETMSAGIAPKLRTRIAGIGIAAPFEMWNWPETVTAPRTDRGAWRDFSFAEAAATFTPLPVYAGNTASLACMAELVYGTAQRPGNFAYFNIGSFVGGGIVLNGAVHAGQTGNAGAFGSIPVGDVRQHGHQLLHHGSIFTLEDSLRSDGTDPDILWAEDADWQGFDVQLEAWIEDTAQHLAIAGVTVCAVIDVEQIVIDGSFPAHIRERLVARTNAAFTTIDTRGLAPPVATAGTLGRIASSLGAGSQPLFSRYLLGQST